MKQSSSNSFENFSETKGVYIKGDFKKETAHKFNIDAIFRLLHLKKEAAIVKNIFHASLASKNLKETFTYTIQEGDDKRLSKNGVLKVYNINEPVEIPVGKLLGQWKKSHIGITLIVSNSQWCIGQQVLK